MEKPKIVRSFDGTRLFTTTLGQGPVVVLCDGIGCDGFIWRHLKEFLRDHYQVIHWNYRGHGRSEHPVHPDALGMSALRADLVAVLDAYNVDQAVLAGHSMGVQVILDTAIEHPERVRALVPICGSYGRPLDTLHGDGHLGKAFPLLRDSVLHWPGVGQKVWRRVLGSRLTQTYARYFEINGRLLNRMDLKAYFDHLGGMDASIFVRMLDRIRLHTVEDKLPMVRQPTLVVGGERDTFTPAWLSHRMHLKIPGAELLIMPSGSHVAPLEIPELIHLRIVQFLKERVFPQDPASGPRYKPEVVQAAVVPRGAPTRARV